ncbi:MAG: leucyl aminopeptidase [Pseudomonadota bacterium]
MTDLAHVSFVEYNLDSVADLKGTIIVFLNNKGKLDRFGRRVNRLCKGVLEKAISKEGGLDGSFLLTAPPANMKADQVILAKTEDIKETHDYRKLGATLVGRVRTENSHFLLDSEKKLVEIMFGAVMNSYNFDAHKSEAKSASKSLVGMCGKPSDAEDLFKEKRAIADGVFFTRDLVNEPANVLTTTEFANRLEALSKLGLTVKTIDEPEMEKLGMGALLGVGQGSESPSKIVVMEWNGGGDKKPLALLGKGVVFDTGGISLKPAAGMEDMTMDMGGAGTVAGVMKTLALRKAKANVVGLVGLVENMPDARAQRPGDVVTSMKGDTIEVINTDAEGRLVLADVLWYAQETYQPTAMIDLATLTGAIIIGLGHENAGVFSNDDGFCNNFLKAAAAESEGAWRMPLGQAYDDMLKSRIADMKNIGGRSAGSVTAAQFLQRFVKEGCPWIHLDIAGVASVKSSTDLSPKGATGWGVRALNRLVADYYE